MPFDGRSRDDVSSEFRGVAGRSGRMEGSDRDHLFGMLDFHLLQVRLVLYYFGEPAMLFSSGGNCNPQYQYQYFPLVVDMI